MPKNIAYHTKPKTSRMAPTPEAGDLLREASYPERLRQLVYLASKGGVPGPRKCLLCSYTGAVTRVFLPPESLRIEAPDTRNVRAYWLCAVCSTTTHDLEVIAAALQQRGLR
jgi:hypothetical protein